MRSRWFPLLLAAARAATLALPTENAGSLLPLPMLPSLPEEETDAVFSIALADTAALARHMAMSRPESKDDFADSPVRWAARELLASGEVTPTMKAALEAAMKGSAETRSKAIDSIRRAAHDILGSGASSGGAHVAGSPTQVLSGSRYWEKMRQPLELYANYIREHAKSLIIGSADEEDVDGEDDDVVSTSSTSSSARAGSSNVSFPAGYDGCAMCQAMYHHGVCSSAANATNATIEGTRANLQMIANRIESLLAARKKAEAGGHLGKDRAPGAPADPAHIADPVRTFSSEKDTDLHYSRRLKLIAGAKAAAGELKCHDDSNVWWDACKALPCMNQMKGVDETCKYRVAPAGVPGANPLGGSMRGSLSQLRKHFFTKSQFQTEQSLKHQNGSLGEELRRSIRLEEKVADEVGDIASSYTYFHARCGAGVDLRTVSMQCHFPAKRWCLESGALIHYEECKRSFCSSCLWTCKTDAERAKLEGAVYPPSSSLLDTILPQECIQNTTMLPMDKGFRLSMCDNPLSKANLAVKSEQLNHAPPPPSLPPSPPMPPASPPATAAFPSSSSSSTEKARTPPSGSSHVPPAAPPAKAPPGHTSPPSPPPHTNRSAALDTALPTMSGEPSVAMHAPTSSGQGGTMFVGTVLLVVIIAAVVLVSWRLRAKGKLTGGSIW